MRTDSATTERMSPGPKKSGERSDDMEEKDDEIAHRSILARNGSAPGMPLNHQFAMDTCRIPLGHWIST